MPAKVVAAVSKGQKNDFRDAEAIAEAVQRPTMKFVATKELPISSTSRRSIACASDWSASAPASSDAIPRLPVGARDCAAAGPTLLTR